MASGLRRLQEHKPEANESHDGPVMNLSQCVSLLLRYCVEPKLLHLLRAYPADIMRDHCERMDSELRQQFLESASAEGLEAQVRDQV